MENQDIGYLIKQVSDKMKAAGDAAFKQKGLTFSQMRVLEFIHARGDQTTQKEIETHLNVAHPTVVGLIHRLEQNEFLYCYTNASDRRSKIVCLTDKTGDILDALRKDRERHEKLFLRCLSDEDIASLRRMLLLISQNLEEDIG